MPMKENDNGFPAGVQECLANLDELIETTKPGFVEYRAMRDFTVQDWAIFEAEAKRSELAEKYEEKKLPVPATQIVKLTAMESKASFLSALNEQNRSKDPAYDRVFTILDFLNNYALAQTPESQEIMKRLNRVSNMISTNESAMISG